MTQKRNNMAENASCESVVANDESYTSQNDEKNVHNSSMCDTSSNNEGSFKIPEGICAITSTDTSRSKKHPANSDSDTTVTSISNCDFDGGSKQHMEEVKDSNFSPSEPLLKQQVTFPYKEPPWSGLPEEKYSFEVLKNGAIIDNINMTSKQFYVFGRLPSCDCTLEHPSLSRYHAVLQYCGDHTERHEKGWYLYDLDSTHGTWVNKLKVKPKVYHRVRVGHVVKFGGSTRLHVLQGPDDDQEEESNLSVTELKEQQERHKREAELLRHAELQDEQMRIHLEKQRLDSEGCSWGISEDAEEPSTENPLQLVEAKDEHLYIDDPKKALKGYFEREGYDLPDYQFVETAVGKHKCTVELPVDSPSGEPIVAEAIVSGKRKDAVIVCALEACRILDKLGVLRASKHDSRRRKGKNWEDDDFYDSDEDTFLDRTGTIEKKRILRMKKIGKTQNNQAETFEMLSEKHRNVLYQIEEIEKELAQAKADAAACTDEDVDALDAYMSAIKSGMMDTKTRMNLKRQLIELKKEEMRLRRLVNIAKPASLPELVRSTSLQNKPVVQPSSVIVGRKKIHKTNLKKPIPQSLKNISDSHDSGEEEEEEDDESENKSSERFVEENKNPDIKTPRNVSQKVEDSNVKLVKSQETKISSSISPMVEDSVKLVSKEPCLHSSIENCLSQKNSDSTHDQSDAKIKGRSLPSSNMQTDLAIHKNSSKRSAIELTINPQKKSKKTTQLSGDYDGSDPDYAVWMPPQAQTGDGRTHLNDKFGY